MNKFIAMGRLVHDPENKTTSNNLSVTRFSLAVNRQGKPQEGQPTADFFNCVAWRQTADFVAKWFQKGQQVLVEGQVRNKNWTDKEGNKRHDTEIVVDTVYFAEGRKQDGGGNQSGETRQNASKATTDGVAGVESGDGFYTINEPDSDLPF